MSEQPPSMQLRAAMALAIRGLKGVRVRRVPPTVTPPNRAQRRAMAAQHRK